MGVVEEVIDIYGSIYYVENDGVTVGGRVLFP
jgi:hypothetical protein